jgi:hypothetical protein
LSAAFAIYLIGFGNPSENLGRHCSMRPARVKGAALRSATIPFLNRTTRGLWYNTYHSRPARGKFIISIPPIHNFEWTAGFN